METKSYTIIKTFWHFQVPWVSKQVCLHVEFDPGNLLSAVERQRVSFPATQLHIHGPTT